MKKATSWRHFKVPGTAPSSPAPRLPAVPIGTPFAISKAAQAIDALCFQIRVAGLPAPEREYAFAAPTRKWRFDLAWPDPAIRTAVEIEGLVFPVQPRWQEGPAEHRLSGRHVSVTGYLADLEKYNTAASLRWILFRCTHKHIEEGRALAWLEERFALLTR